MNRHTLQRHPRRNLCIALSGLAAWVVAGSVAAATCGLNVQGVAFGNYDYQSSQDLDSVGHINVTCDVGTAYTIALSPGLVGTFTTRIMQNGSHQLAYNLYADPAHATVWGDGTGSGVTVSGSTANADFPVYGSIPARQNPYVGSYSDVVTVTLSF